MKFDPNKTWVTVSAVVAAGASLAGAIVWCTATYTSQAHFNSAILGKLTEMKQSIDKLNNDGVSIRNFQQWAELLRARNATLIVPELPK